MIDLNPDELFKKIVSDSKEEIKWKLNLDCFILKVIPIPSSTLIWVVGSEENVFLVDTGNLEVVNKFEHIAEIIFSAVLQPKTSDLIICTSCGVCLLTSKGEVVSLIVEDNWFEHLCVSSDGKVLLVSKGKTLYTFVQKNGTYELIDQDSSFNSTISDIIFNIDSFLVSNYGGVREYDISNLKDYTLFEWKTSLLNLSWSPDKKYIAAGTQENAIHFWPYPLEKEQDFQMGGYSSKVNIILWSADAKEFIVNGFEDIHIWDFSDGPPLGKMPKTLDFGFGKIIDIIYNGTLLVAASNEGAFCYFFPSKSDQFIHIRIIDDEITCLSFSDDEDELYVGSKSGNLYCF